MKNNCQNKENISGKIFSSELNTAGNKAFMKQYNIYQQTKDIYQRAQQAMGRTKTFQAKNSSTINAKLNTNGTASTI